ncbi:MAG: C39 family peptidase [Candidatus Sericytochromatia bacterium]|nr:C39 family peptidase [Candidatus Sericytochromatia bacterium]
MTAPLVRRAFQDHQITGDEASSLVAQAERRLHERQAPVSPETLRTEMAAMIQEAGLGAPQSAVAATRIVDAFVRAGATPVMADRFETQAFDPAEFRFPDPTAGAMEALAGTSLPVSLQTQKGNACGTTSLSMLLTYYGAPAADAHVTRIDAAIRSTGPVVDMFTAPGDIVAYARGRGFQATMRHGAGTDDLRTLIDQGVPALILYDCDDRHDGSGLHYSLVTGYQDTDGKRAFTLADPHGVTRTLSESQLLRQWSALKVKAAPGSPSVATPYHRVLFAVIPKTGRVTTPTGATRDVGDLWLPPDNASVYAKAANAVAGLVGLGGRLANHIREGKPTDLAPRTKSGLRG